MFSPATYPLLFLVHSWKEIFGMIPFLGGAELWTNKGPAASSHLPISKIDQI